MERCVDISVMCCTLLLHFAFPTVTKTANKRPTVTFLPQMGQAIPVANVYGLVSHDATFNSTYKPSRLFATCLIEGAYPLHTLKNLLGASVLLSIASGNLQL